MVDASEQEGPAELELDENVGSTEEEDEYEDDDLPTFEFRFETAKLLIELDDKTHAATKAWSLTACPLFLANVLFSLCLTGSLRHPE